MKRVICLALALMLTAGFLWGCGKKDKDGKKDPVSTVSTVSAATPTPKPTPAKTAKAAKVKADDGLNVRAKPSLEGEILGLAESGSMLPLLTSTSADGWYQVEYEGKSAYVSADYVEVQNVTQEEYERLKKGESGVSDSSKDESSDVSGSSGSDDPQGKTSSSSSSSSSPLSSAASSSAAGINRQDGE